MPLGTAKARKIEIKIQGESAALLLDPSVSRLVEVLSQQLHGNRQLGRTVDNHSVFNPDGSISELEDSRIVGNDEHCPSALMRQIAHHLHDGPPGM
jgi:hypothetical protein